jgi:hypothetical protein
MDRNLFPVRGPSSGMVSMLTTCRSATLAMVLALASGCSESPSTEPRLIPVLDDRGLITYRYESPDPAPEPATSSGHVAVRAPMPSYADDRQRRQDEQYDRDMAEWRRGQYGQAHRAEAAQEEAIRNLRQSYARQERQEWLNYQAQEANRRQMIESEAQSRARAESLRQQQEARDWFRYERDQQQQAREWQRSQRTQ